MADTSASTPSAAPVTTTPAAKPAVPPVAADKAAAASQSVAAKAPVADDSWDVQIDGKTERKSRKEILEAYQMRQLSDRKRAEAEKVLTEYNKVFETSKKDPIKFLKAMGVDFDQLSTSYLSKKAEEAMMDPKERELQAARKEADEYKKYVAEQKAAQEKAAKEGEVSAARQAIHKDIIDAIEEAKDTLGLPVDEELIIAVAQKMLLQDAKQKPLNAKEALPRAYEAQQKYLKSIAAKMEGEHLVKWLGDDVAKKIRKYDLQQLKAKRVTPVAQARVEPKADSAQPAKPYKTWSQFKAERLDTIK